MNLCSSKISLSMFGNLKLILTRFDKHSQILPVITDQCELHSNLKSNDFSAKAALTTLSICLKLSFENFHSESEGERSESEEGREIHSNSSNASNTYQSHPSIKLSWKQISLF